jgi:SOS-response transcriptional repressor LexA
MTETPVLFAEDTDFVLKVRDTTLEPDYQPGDHVSVRQAKTAEPGQIVVALVDEAAVLIRWPAEDARVLGVVTGMFRRLA